jgi:tetratricopeptide (TPR) repeat protein
MKKIFIGISHPAIEDPRSKQRGIFDPMEFFILCSLTPQQAAGNVLAGIQKINEENSRYLIYQKYIGVLFLGLTLMILSNITMAQSPVTISEVEEVIPTYLAGPPDPNPMFFFGKGSQGAEGRIYPYPLYDNLTNKKSDKTYHLVYLENEFVKIGIMPEIGGRVFSALDKTNNYDFIYHQHVIKPALIGLIGAWISGGIEWNIPHHHRASTFLPVQWSKEEHPDGSKTVWVGELEVRQRMRWAVGYTLRPGSSILECSLRIVNRTPMVNTMLCFANVAVHTNENYQVIFPPSTQWSTGHSKRSFSPWPVTNNVDVSWYKNNNTSASWFAVNYEDDFVAGYDHGKNAGIMTIADHNIIPGKKFFTWGVGNMWDKILTDNDGPYLEIMVGAYSDNQPDYSWMQPYEERSFELSWYPFRGIDGVKKANLDAAVNLDVKDGKAIFGFYTTKAYKNATASLAAGNKVLSREEISIDPGKPYSKQIALPAGLDEHELRASISAEGHELVAYTPVRLTPTPKPAGTTNPAAPADIKNDEELFLAGQRIDQFHNPSLDANPYWEEALRRDSGNIAANTGMGLLNLRNAKYIAAEKYFRKAIERLTAQYTTPKNAEPFYYLGVALKGQGRFDEAFTSFYKATWSQEWKSPSYFSLAEIASLKGDFPSALNLVNRSIDANALNVRAYGLKAAVLRHLDRNEEALRLVDFAKDKTDPLDVRLMSEQWLLTKDIKASQTLFTTLNTHPATAQETAAEYYNAGLWGDGLDVLQQAVSSAPKKENVSPLVYYYLGYFSERLGNDVKAAEYRLQATFQPTDYVFPFQDEVITILRSAIKSNPKDARAPYFLGTLLYDWQPDEAITLWEKSSELDPNFPITWRNLSIAYSHKPGKDFQAKAISCLEKAVSIGIPYSTHLAELDALYENAGTSVDKRLAILEKNQKVVVKNDVALGSLINLKTFTGKTDESISLLKNRIFSIWEGNTPFNSGQAWTDANFIHGLQNLKMKKYKEALADFGSALETPENLRAEQRFDQRREEIAYWTGCAYAGIGEKEKAQKSWNEVVSANASESRTGNSGRRNDNNPLSNATLRYYQSLAKQKLGNKDGNEAVFNDLIASATSVINQSSSKQTLQERETSRTSVTMAHYIAGLGYAGLGNKTKARAEFNAALLSEPDYLNAKIALDQL